MPVYEWNHLLHTYKVTEIAQALLESSLTAPKVCHHTPTNVEHNCTFLVNQSKLKSQSDLKVDDYGSWKNNGIRCVIILVNSGKTTVIAWEKKVKTYKMENGQYLLTRNYFTHRTSEDFRKIIFTLSGNYTYKYCFV